MHTRNGTVPFLHSNRPKENVTESLQWLWKIHWIVFSILFFIIGSYCLIPLIKTIRKTSELTRNYRLAIFSLIIIISFSRTLYLIFDPYEIDVALFTDVPRAVLRLIYSLGQPSVTAGFGLIHALFLNVAKVRHYRQSPILKTKVILVIIAVYFAFGMLAELMTAFFPNLNAMLAVSAGLSVVGCTVVTVTITYSGMKILRTATQNRKVLYKGIQPFSAEEMVKAKSVAKVAKVTLAASTFCAGITIANSVAFVKMIMPGVREWKDMWQLFIFVSSVRILEIAMTCTLVYALSRSATKSDGNISLFRRLTKYTSQKLSRRDNHVASDEEEKAENCIPTTTLSVSNSGISTS